jgi:hypothetical protein
LPSKSCPEAAISRGDAARIGLAAKARISPADFAEVTSWGRWNPSPHLSLVNESLMRIISGEISRLMVFLPPRHGKSELISKYLPAWYLGTFPDRRVILTSYEADFAAQWGRRTRDLLEEHGNIFPLKIQVREGSSDLAEYTGLQIRSDSSAAYRWDVANYTGGMTTAGVRGPITGKGAHLIIIDDPVKNAEEAMSVTIQERTWEWFKSTLYTRLEPGGAIILIMTRWVNRDLSGRLIQEMEDGDGDRWTVISLPALAEKGDPLGRKEGEALWPERYPADQLQRIRGAVGSHWWAALYQQRPVPREGGLFHYEVIEEQRRQRPSALIRIVVGVDPAVTSDKESAETGIVVAGISADNHVYIMGDHSLKGTPLEWARAVVRAYHSHKADRVIGEVNNGGDLVEVNLRTVDRSIPFKAVHASRGKILRAEPIAALYEQGRVHHSGTFPQLEDQLCGWVPGERSPDRMDALVWAVWYLTERSMAVQGIDEATGGGGEYPGFDDEGMTFNDAMMEI